MSGIAIVGTTDADYHATFLEIQQSESELPRLLRDVERALHLPATCASAALSFTFLRAVAVPAAPFITPAGLRRSSSSTTGTALIAPDRRAATEAARYWTARFEAAGASLPHRRWCAELGLPYYAWTDHASPAVHPVVASAGRSTVYLATDADADADLQQQLASSPGGARWSPISANDIPERIHHHLANLLRRH